MGWIKAVLGGWRGRISAVFALPVLLMLWALAPFRSVEAPGCDHGTVVATVRDIFNTHPDYIGRSATALTGVAAMREAAHRWHPEVNETANTRWCEAEAIYANGARETVYYDLFSTRTLFGPTYGVRPCYGSHDPRHRDCAFARPPK